MQQQEDTHGDDDHHRNRREQAPDDVGGHKCDAVPLVCVALGRVLDPPLQRG
jgi:hypothetical protein